MDENTTGAATSEQEEVIEATSQEPASPEENVEENEELAKARELANNYKIRAEKAEKALKQKETAKNEAPAPSHDNLSTADTLALVQAQVSPEDVSEVIEYARYKKISVVDALKTNVVKTLLTDRAEERKTAAATHTGTTRRAPQKVQASTLVSKAEDGDLPDDEEEMKRLWRVRKGLEQ